MPDLPTGTVTLLFTDIEGSTRLLQQQGEHYGTLLAEYRAVVRSIFQTHHGHEVDTQGDSFFVVFPRAVDAVRAAVAAQQALAAHPWPDGVTFRTRMGVHTGEPQVQGGTYVGLDVHRAARISAAGHGGQVLLSQTTRDLVVQDLPDGVRLHDLGVHRLKDLQQPEHLFQVVLPDLPADFPPIKTLDSRPNNLPLQPTSFVGREREVEAVLDRLRDPQVCLVTLMAAGGSGKTRLALQVATALLDDFPDGVWLVDLAPVSDPALVAATIAQVLVVKEAGGQPLVEMLTAYLRDKHLLLVLDNFEQVVSAAPLLDALLHAAPSLKLLVTSRIVLGVYGEHTIDVPPLTLPDRSPNLPLEDLARCEAVRLFIERAQAAKADFHLTNENAPSIIEICHRLDGLPLAIELAAARIRLLPAPALLQRLSSRLNVLTGGARTLPTRQQTLRNAIAWSYDLLDPPEQTLFRRLGVFVGGWTLEAAEAVCAAGDGLGLDVLDGLQSLLEKSMLRQQEGADGEPRFTMLETMREYALERLVTSGEDTLLRQQHAHFFLTVVETAERSRSTPDRPVWLRRLLRDHDNLRAALTWTRDAADGATLLRLAGALQWFWDATDNFSENREWLEAAVRLDDAHDQTSLPSQALRRGRAKVLYGAGNLALALGDRVSAERQYEESAQLFRAIGDNEGLARVLSALGEVAWSRGEFAMARAFQEESATLWRDLGLKPDLAWTLAYLAGATLDLGDTAAARALYEESRALSQEVGNRHGVAVALGGLAEASVRQHDLETAQRLYEACLATMRELDSKSWIGIFLMDLGDIATTQGDYGLATARYEAIIPVWRGIGHQPGVAVALLRLGDVALRQQEYDQAGARYTEALELSTASGDQQGRTWALRSVANLALQQEHVAGAKGLLQEALTLFSAQSDNRGIAACQEDMARVAVAQGQAERAARLLAAATAWRERKGGQRLLLDDEVYERTLAAVRAQLDEATFKAAWEEGRAMPLEQAVAYALEETPHA